MCISSDENMRSSRRPVSRNNEHDYSAWKIDEYDMDLSEYLIEEPPIKDDDDAESLLETHSPSEEKNPLELFDETQNFDVTATIKKGRKSYACPVCKKLWITPSKLKRHIASHKAKEDTPQPSPEQTQCPICNCLLDSPQKLTQHMARAHVKSEGRKSENEKVLLIAEKIGSKYICKVCGVEVNSPSKLSAHMQARHMRKKGSSKKNGKYKCHVCNKFCVTPSKLERHLRVHTKIKKPANYKRPPGPRRHECLSCDKKFETPSKLFRHTSTVHKEVTKNEKPSEMTLKISAVESITGD